MNAWISSSHARLKMIKRRNNLNARFVIFYWCSRNLVFPAKIRFALDAKIKLYIAPFVENSLKLFQTENLWNS